MEGAVTAHCLRFSEVWAEGFRIDPPVLEYNIDFDIW
jgi:hypothetical protein